MALDAAITVQTLRAGAAAAAGLAVLRATLFMDLTLSDDGQAEAIMGAYPLGSAVEDARLATFIPAWYPYFEYSTPGATDWTEVEIYTAAGVKQLGPYSIQAAGSTVKMLPIEYVLAGHAGLAPGTYKHRHRVFSEGSGTYGPWSGYTTLPAVAYDDPGIPLQADVAPVTGTSPLTTVLAFNTPNASGWQVTVDGPSGYHEVFTVAFEPETDPGSENYGRMYVATTGSKELTLTTGGTYTWSVRGYNPLGYSVSRPGPDIGVGVVPVPALGKPVNVYPTPGAALPVSGAAINFQWSAAAGAASYVVVVANRATSELIYAYVNVGNVLEIDTELVPVGDYLWWVIAVNSGETLYSWGDATQFTVF